MSLSEFFTQSEQTDVSLGIVGGEVPEQLHELLTKIFDRQSVEIRRSVTVPEPGSASADRVYLLNDGEVIAESPLEEVADSILLVNSDLYTTGARSVQEVDLPDVITALDETHFRLRGYPESNKEKLLLITISRYIERTALEHGTGNTVRPSNTSHVSTTSEVRGRSTNDLVTAALTPMCTGSRTGRHPPSTN
jgi:ABC-type multidrug transport system ATPase subunit